MRLTKLTKALGGLLILDGPPLMRGPRPFKDHAAQASACGGRGKAAPREEGGQLRG